MFYFGTNTKQQLNQELHEEVVEMASLLAKSNKDTQFFVLPTMPLLQQLKKMSFGTGLWVGPQRVSGTDSNTTGEISAKLIKDLDADLVMVGHAERRALGESEQELKQQLQALQENQLMSIYCIGEKQKEVNKDIRKELFKKQLNVLKELNIDRALIGYEPVWSIGVNGTPAESSYVEESFVSIKEVLNELGLNIKNYPLLYGGSVNIDNAKELASLDNCDGLFVGRSAWSKDGFRNVYDKAHAGYKSKQDLSA
ncbi:MAG: triosephosphate isomerase TpiA1 [Actinomycetota bacterium]|jgi:triosephosphate isomerase